MSEIQETLKAILQKLESLEVRIERIEQRPNSPPQQNIQPALARVIKTLRDIGQDASADDIAKHTGLSRNRASAYLNELSSTGIIDKRPNLKKTDARYLFGYNPDKTPPSLRKQIEEEQ